eukprot:TRINITY_DN124_c0_g1_i5.p1 TRINITY_DN124_c0_g1~~TRINITY_DN124_c0_g1_i5.p1  ORF type:complete len:409 (-),score=82.65 TRINITY_DN124_c0_g1_i5:1644-2870(-)
MEDLITHANSRQSLLTCITCRLQFASIALQKDHYKTDLHRFNLKRKVAGLPPVSEDAFLKRLGEHHAKTLVAEQIIASCTLCGKSYNSENSYAQHIESKKHKEKVANALYEGISLPPPERFVKRIELENARPPTVQTKDIVSKMMGDKTDDIQPDLLETESNISLEDEEADNHILETATTLDILDCLFCRNKAVDFQSNLDHMTRSHSFFIPEIEYLVDLEGLIKYLGEKVSIGRLCLYCNGKGRTFQTIDAVRNHMHEKSHCKILYEEETIDEFADFYDFTPSYERGDSVMPIDGKSEPQTEGDEQPGDWEEDDSTNDELSLDGEMRSRIRAIKINSANELIVSEGKKIGHRDLALYYKQKPHIRETKYSGLVQQLSMQYQTMALQGGDAYNLPPSTSMCLLAKVAF